MKFFAFCASLILSFSLFSQQFKWVTTHEQSDASDYARDIIVDQNGYIYTCGTFEDTVDFDYTQGVQELISNGTDDIFIQKHDSLGNLVWAKSIGGANYDRPTCLALASDGNIYLSGYYSGAVDFDPGPGTSMNSAIGQDAFYAKLDTAANLIWSKFISGSNGEIVTAITEDASGNIIVAGHYAGSVDFDPNAGVAYMSSSGFADCFVVKLDNNANYIWSRDFGGSQLDWVHFMDTDSDDNIITTGRYQSTNMDFDPGAGVSASATSGTSDVFVHQLDSAGNFVWASTANGAGFQEPNKVFVDSQDNVYVTGFGEDSIVFDGANNSIYQQANSHDVFIWKLNQSGTHQWSHLFGGSGFEFGYDIAEGENGEIYFTGTYTGTVDFAPGMAIDTLSTDGSFFLTRYDANANLMFKYRNELPSYCAIKAITTQGSDVYVSGEYLGTVDFNYGAGVDTLSKTGSLDVFVMKLGNLSTSGLESNEIKAQLYPNPVPEGDFITFVSNENISKLTIYSNNGQVIKTVFNKNQISTSGLKSGVYLIKIETTTGSLVKRVIVQ